MVKSLSVFFFVILLSNLSFSQILSGVIIDSHTREPIPFVNVYSPDINSGTSSDIDGKFTIDVSKINQLEFTCIGYRKKTIVTISADKNYVLIVELDQNTETLNEIVIHPNDSQVISIVKRAIANRDKNNPENLESYKYNSYNKLFSTLEGYESSSPSDLKDSTQVSNFLTNTHLFVSESYTEKIFLKPNREKETILANKFSGSKNPFITVLLTDYSTFSIYKNYVSLLGTNYISPLSSYSLNNYQFILQDEISRSNDTLYSIYYVPLRKNQSNTLTGVMSISSKKYAVENISAFTNSESLITLKLFQNYVQLETCSFPNQLNSTLVLNDFKIKERKMQFVYRGYIENVKENIVIDKSKFDAISVVFDPRANKRDSLYWVNIRSSPLSIKDKKTYFTYDTLRTNKGFSIEKFMNLYKWSALGYVPIGPFDFQLNKLFKFNDYEKLRIGFGITTNKSISKKFKLSSYLGWGVEDNALKFGGDVTIFPTQNVTTTFRLFYDQDVVESASPKIAYQAGTFIFNNETFRDFAVSRMDSINAFGLEFNFKPSIFLWSSVSITSKIVNPTYDYLYTISDESSSEFKATETALLFYYAFGRKMIQLGNDFVFTRPQYPLFKFKITQAIPATFNDKFKYSKFEFDLFNSFNSPLGTTSTNITGGLLINEAPYPLLFNGKGFNSDNYATFFYLYSNFQTMGLTEFISDRYVNIFLQQNFGNILNIPKINFFKPSFSLTYSGGIGNLKNKSSHSGISFKTMEKGYHESGIILDNLIRLKYLRTLYVGFGVGAFYRYGYYEFSTPSDNVAIKASIKIGF